MARGIPFVYASDDPVLNAYPMEYVMRIANDESPVPIADVIAFAERCASVDNIPQVMRKYAEEHMTWEGQFKKVFNYFGN